MADYDAGATAPESDNSKFQIYRFADSPTLVEANCMEILPFTETQIEGFKAMHMAGPERGDETIVLFSIPGFSLTYAWFKKDYPLPLHSHSSDCLYYIVSGSLKLGTEWLGPRDGFFIPDGVPYTYTPGPEGLEILEFRHKQHFDFNLMAKGAAFWKRAADTTAANQEAWKVAKKPVLNA